MPGATARLGQLWGHLGGPRANKPMDTTTYGCSRQFAVAGEVHLVHLLVDPVSRGTIRSPVPRCCVRTPTPARCGTCSPRSLPDSRVPSFPSFDESIRNCSLGNRARQPRRIVKCALQNVMLILHPSTFTWRRSRYAWSRSNQSNPAQPLHRHCGGGRRGVRRLRLLRLTGALSITTSKSSSYPTRVGEGR